MTTTTKTRKSPAERHAEIVELQASIADRVAELRDSDAWRRFLVNMARFHRYSLRNQLLILSQNPQAEQVASYSTWRTMGRQVRKGEHGIKILAPCAFRTEPEPDDTDNNQTAGRTDTDDTPKIRLRFKIVRVFDITQTDVFDAEKAANPLEAATLDGDDPDGIYLAAAEWLAGQGWSIEREDIPGTVEGFTAQSQHRIVIDRGLTPAMAASVLLHEAAHAVLHAELKGDEYLTHRGIAETEAESVAFVVAATFGLDTTTTTIPYVAGWSKCSPAMFTETADHVVKAAHRIIDGMAPTD